MTKDILAENAFQILRDAGMPVLHVSESRRYWFIRTQGGDYFSEFFLDGFVGIGHEDVPCIPEDKRTEEVIAKVRETHPQATRVMNQVYKFCKEIHENDIVIIPSASSAQFAFGVIEDSEIYTVEPISDEEKEDGKCPFTRRHKTRWIQGIPKARVDSKLYTFFRNQQTLSSVDDYSEFIERAIHPFYIKNEQAHLTLSINTAKSPNAFDMPLYIGGILTRAKDIYNELGLDAELADIRSRTNVQSAGLIELFGDPVFVAFVGIICIALFGGKISFESDGHSIKGKAETGGLIDAVLKILDRYKDNKTIGNDKIKEAQRRLEVDDPRKKNKEQD